MAASASTQAVWFALIGNGFLTVVKFFAFMASGSGAMFSEAIHSLADTANQGLLAVGIKRSLRPADAMFPYGFGGERYLFALLSAVGIFVLGCGVTLYHGVHMLLEPEPLHITWHPYAVLTLALLVDGFVLSKALAAVNAERGERGLLEHLRQSSDPTVSAVLLEDGVACLGVIIALVALGVAQFTGSTLPDAVATLVIGCMLGGVAIWLGVQNRSLIVGRAIPAPVQAAVLAYLTEQPTVSGVRNVRSRIVGAGSYRLTAELDWDGAALAAALHAWVESRADSLATPEERASFTREFGARFAEVHSAEIDRIEAQLRERFPELHYLDFESD
ncbi:MAG: cation diffusion facilitator transporter [Planctomycetota bacterium]|nr:MAG: cation diffusion facilitator transporter [Planctomycetota bacterium]